MGFLESATGIGMMGGPIIGQITYTAFGFGGCFYSTAIVISLAGSLVYFIAPNSLNIDTAESEESETKIKFKDITGNFKAMAAIFSCIIATVFLMYTEPVISNVLIDIGVSKDYIGI